MTGGGSPPLVSLAGGVLTAVVATADGGGTLCEPALEALRQAVEGIGDASGEPVAATAGAPAVAPVGAVAGAVAGPAAPPPAGDIRVVLLVSENKNFCTGGDIAAFAAARDPSVEVRRQADALHRCLLALAAAPIPVVAAVNGWAAGAGMSLVCQCDLVVAGESTRLRPGYPSLGFSPDGGLTWTLPRLAGVGRAREILYTDRVVEAPEALALGLVHRVVADDEVRATAREQAQRLAAGPTGAYGRIKRLLARSATATMAEQFAAEATAVADGAGTAEGREGVAAFLQRRPPRFAPVLHAGDGGGTVIR